MQFSEYLTSRKIDAIAFERGAPEVYAKWKKSFDLMHPASFAARYLFKINALRRKFTLRTEMASTPTTSSKPRPVIKPKIN
jgi:hypothetical protein